MAAAYQTGTATSPNNLLQTLVTWLVAQGWTQNMSQADSTGWRAHLSKSGVYINLRSTLGEASSTAVWAGGVNTGVGTNLIGIGLYVGTGYSGASAWNAQAGGPIGNGQSYTVGSFMQLPVGAITAYHFFDDGSDNIVVVVERTAGIFTHMGWGPSMTKAGAWTGGAYFFAPLPGFFGNTTSPSAPGHSSLTAVVPFAHADYQGGQPAFVRADVDAFTGKWLGVSNNTSTSQYGYTGRNCASGYLVSTAIPVEIPSLTFFRDRLTSSLNSQANLVPNRVYVPRDAGGFSLLGEVPNVMVSNAYASGFSHSTVYPLGSENWMIFPNFAVRKWA